MATIKIKNWDKYNPKRDQSSYTWFRCSNEIFSGMDFSDFCTTEIAIWLSILSESSKKNADTVDVKYGFLARCGRCDEVFIEKTISKLISEGYIEIVAPADATATTTAPTTPTNERTDVTNETNERTEPPENPPDPNPDSPPITPDNFIDAYNRICAGQGKIEKYNELWLSGNSAAEFKNRSEKPGYRKLSEWEAVLQRVRLSAYLCGEDKKHKFVLTLPWLLKADNFTTLATGGYPATRKVEKALSEPPAGVDYDTWIRQQPQT